MYRNLIIPIGILVSFFFFVGEREANSHENEKVLWATLPVPGERGKQCPLHQNLPQAARGHCGANNRPDNRGGGAEGALHPPPGPCPGHLQGLRQEHSRAGQLCPRGCPDSSRVQSPHLLCPLQDEEQQSSEAWWHHQVDSNRWFWVKPLKNEILCSYWPISYDDWLIVKLIQVTHCASSVL